MEWQNFESPSLNEIERLASESYARLPEKFRALCGGIIFRVEDFPSAEVLKEMDAEPFDLLGLFTGIGLAQAGAVPETGTLPNTVHLYRRAILDYWAEHEETLGTIVTHVLARDRAPFRAFRRGHGADRGGDGGLSRGASRISPAHGRCLKRCRRGATTPPR